MHRFPSDANCGSSCIKIHCFTSFYLLENGTPVRSSQPISFATVTPYENKRIHFNIQYMLEFTPREG